MSCEAIMKILTKSHAEWHATLNVFKTHEGRYGWEVEIHDPLSTPTEQLVSSPTAFQSSTSAAVDGLRAMDGLGVNLPTDQDQHH